MFSEVAEAWSCSGQGAWVEHDCVLGDASRVVGIVRWGGRWFASTDEGYRNVGIAFGGGYGDARGGGAEGWGLGSSSRGLGGSEVEFFPGLGDCGFDGFERGVYEPHWGTQVKGEFVSHVDVEGIGNGDIHGSGDRVDAHGEGEQPFAHSNGELANDVEGGHDVVELGSAGACCFGVDGVGGHATLAKGEQEGDLAIDVQE